MSIYDWPVKLTREQVSLVKISPLLYLDLIRERPDPDQLMLRESPPPGQARPVE